MKHFPVYYPDIYLQLNMFRAFSCPSSGAHDCSSSLWYYLFSACLVKPDGCYCLVQFSL